MPSGHCAAHHETAAWLGGNRPPLRRCGQLTVAWDAAAPPSVTRSSDSPVQRIPGRWPSLRHTVLGTAMWSGTMGVSAAAALLADGWVSSPRIALVSGLFALAGLLAFVPSTVAARMLSAGRARGFRVALNLLLLAATTIGAAALLYAVQYRFYYDEWHAPAFSTIWFYELGFTGLAALYQFAVLGMRLFFPIGFAALLIAAFWLAGREH